MNAPSAGRVLVLDDHDSLRRNIVATLSDEGFTVLEARTGEEALAIVATEPLDVAIVDMRLPGISGDEFMEQAHQKVPGLRFIVHTGSVDYTLSSYSSAFGLTEEDLFFKPIGDLDLFCNRIRTQCEAAHTGSTA